MNRHKPIENAPRQDRAGLRGRLPDLMFAAFASVAAPPAIASAQGPQAPAPQARCGAAGRETELFTPVVLGRQVLGEVTAFICEGRPTEADWPALVALLTPALD